MSQYAEYGRWLVENDSRESEIGFEEWLAGTFPNDVALQREHVIAAVICGEIRKTDISAGFLRDAVLDLGNDLRAGVAAMARTRMGRITSLMAHVDRIEAMLMERIDAETA